MVAHIRKYKAFILAGVLCAYMAGNFQGLFLEGLHQLTHLADVVRTEFQHSYYNHVHEDGKVHTHRHVVLEVIDDSLDEAGKELPLEDQQQRWKKKNPEQRSLFDPMAILPHAAPAKPEVEVFAVFDRFPKVPTPPPRRSA